MNKEFLYKKFKSFHLEKYLTIIEIKNSKLKQQLQNIYLLKYSIVIQHDYLLHMK